MATFVRSKFADQSAEQHPGLIAGNLILCNNSHDGSFYVDTEWTWDFLQGLQEGLGFIAIASGVKNDPVIQRWRADQRHPAHLFCPLGCPGVVHILDDK